MSWSISKQGKAADVRKEVETELGKITYLEGKEAEVKEAAGALVLTALDATNPDKNVNVAMSGHANVEGTEQVQQIVSVSVSY